MRSLIPPAALAGALIAFAAGAQAQEMYPGEDVTVNPAVGGSRVLLYPGGQYMRVVPALREPGDKDGVVHLHPPRRALARTQKPDSAAPAPRRVAEAPTPAPRVRAPRATPAPKIPAREPAATASAAPASPSVTPTFTPLPDGSVFFGSGPEGSTTAPPERALTRAAPSRPAAAQLARTEPAPAQSGAQSRGTPAAGTQGLVKRSEIRFAPNASDPAQSALEAIKFLAGDLNAALSNSNSRIQIIAYGGTRGDKSSDARRLSLKRALAIRQIFIDDGVPAERIDVHAEGGVNDDGPPDRVDVYIRA